MTPLRVHSVVVAIAAMCGAFGVMAQNGDAGAGIVTVVSSDAGTPVTENVSADDGPRHPRGLRCDACHTPGGWTPAKFAHERTGFPLQGRHQAVACRSCHRRDWREPVPESCAGCHTDPHAQEFGLLCRSCHSEDRWQPLFLVDAHRRTQFPLSGRHATIPCQECHVEQRERTFTRTAVGCVGCHGGDLARASQTTINHGPLGQNCLSCHLPTSFSPARLVAHEPCFPIGGTVHAPVRCVDCHVQSALVRANLSGSCRGVPVRCAECHVHAKGVTDNQHVGVVGYAHASERCAGCHQTTR